MGCDQKDKTKKDLETTTIVAEKQLSDEENKESAKQFLDSGCIATSEKKADSVSNPIEANVLDAEKKNFNKSICISNIRELLRQNPDVKIGQIEKDAGVQPGYMSRLEKDGNTADPSVEFVVTAAKIFNVSIDTLVDAEITALSPQEQYIAKFFNKLKNDTLSDKLYWVRETAFELSNIHTIEYATRETSHPLVVLESCCEYEGNWYEDGIRFTSKSFGPTTYIGGDCFNLRLKNGTKLYLMNVEKQKHNGTNPKNVTIEAWMVIPRSGKEALVTSRDKSPIASMLLELYETVKDHMDRPRINKDALYAINSFMEDDLTDDPIYDDDVPF